MIIPTKEQYNQMINRIKKEVEFYENTPLKRRKIRLYLSNGEMIEFMFKTNCIPHLLGVKTLPLKYAKILSEEYPMEMLKEILSMSKKIYTQVENGFINYFDVFSEHMDEKLDSFETVLKFSIRNILFACKYEVEKTYINGDKNNFGCNYYIVLESEDNEYIFLGLKKDEHFKYYTPSSIIKTNDLEELRRLIQNQQIMLVNSFVLDDIGHSVSLRNYEKMLLLQKLIPISEQYGSNLIVARTLQYDLKKVMIDKDRIEIYNNILFRLTSCISKGKKFNLSSMPLEESLSDLIEAYNETLDIKNYQDINQNLFELRELRLKLQEAKEKINEQESKINLLQQENLSQSAQLEQQEKELESLREFKKETFQLIKKYNWLIISFFNIML